jgi:tryptophan synthase beta subunit
MSYHVNEKGYYGEFGAYIPEMLYQMLKSYIKLFKITAEPSFQAEFDSQKNMWDAYSLCILQSACLKNTIQKYI